MYGVYYAGRRGDEKMSNGLNLSEFEKITGKSPRPLLRQTKREGPTKEQGITASRKSHEVGKYKFIPVGFSQRHLDILDEAIYKLKKEGHLKASRSAIIRILIERYATEVIQSYKGQEE